MSLIKEYRARLRASHTSTGWLVRSVALSVRFIDKVPQIHRRVRPSVRGAGEHDANVSVSGQVAMEEGAVMPVRIPRSGHPPPSGGARCRWEAGRRTEIAFDGLHLGISETEILHVAESPHRRFQTPNGVF